MKLISFAIWGQNPKYLIGAIRNADLAQVIYPDWVCRFYVGTSVPEQIVSILSCKTNVQVVRKQEWGDWRSSFWRFEPMSEEDVEIMISRDCDSRLNKREKDAVNEWMESDCGFHIMKDHPWHFTYPILAGMFGCKKGTLKNLDRDITNFIKIDWYHTDQEFLKSFVYPKIMNDCLVHDSINNTGKKFPSSREKLEFIGESFDENDNNVPEHADVLRRSLA